MKLLRKILLETNKLKILLTPTPKLSEKLPEKLTNKIKREELAILLPEEDLLPTKRKLSKKEKPVQESG